MNNHDELIQEVIEEFEKRIKTDSELSRYRVLAQQGKLTYQEATQYAYRSGVIETEVLKEFAIKETEQIETLKQLLNPIMEKNYNYVSNITKEAQKMLNKNADIGLNPIIPEYQQMISENILDAYENVESAMPTLSKKLINLSHKSVDYIAMKNAQFHDGVGLQVKVTRIYDNVGVHTNSKREDCYWCKSRCGNKIPYKEAMQRGIFQRHEGCGCTIIYESGKRKLIQSRGDWEHNNWNTKT